MSPTFVAWASHRSVEPRQQRIADTGNPWAGFLEKPGRIDTLLEWWQRDLSNGLGELSFPPDFPKMPGEPPRVQPSKKNPENWTDDGQAR